MSDNLQPVQLLLAASLLLEHLQHLINGEAGGLLAWWVFFERH